MKNSDKVILGIFIFVGAIFAYEMYRKKNKYEMMNLISNGSSSGMVPLKKKLSGPGSDVKNMCNELDCGTSGQTCFCNPPPISDPNGDFTCTCAHIHSH